MHHGWSLPLTRLHSKGRLRVQYLQAKLGAYPSEVVAALASHIRVNTLTVANTLAFCNTYLITAVKSFVADVLVLVENNSSKKHNGLFIHILYGHLL